MGPISGTELARRKDRRAATAADGYAIQVACYRQEEQPDRVEETLVPELHQRTIRPPIDVKLNRTKFEPTLDYLCDCIPV
jgi:hypothetical protein